MDNNGFFTAPCSGQYHLCKEGGLAEHSLNVYRYTYAVAVQLLETQSIIDDDFMNGLIIVSLLHDLGKAGQFGKPNYVPNLVSDKKGGYVQSDKKPYETNKELLAVPHEIRSIQIASQFIELTEDESFAILQHNGMYGDLKYSLQGKETPLQMLLHFADMWCSRVVEV
jgi:23S rRNA maturation-related 3'-5' exoribonuclease YhaM